MIYYIQLKCKIRILYVYYNIRLFAIYISYNTTANYKLTVMEKCVLRNTTADQSFFYLARSTYYLKRIEAFNPFRSNFTVASLIYRGGGLCIYMSCNLTIVLYLLQNLTCVFGVDQTQLTNNISIGQKQTRDSFRYFNSSFSSSFFFFLFSIN